jgi:glycosyltransferase involved in cell wall biosynthesis
MTKNSIAVLIPTKNRLALLRRALASVYGRPVLPDEVIVVNDGSSDGTREYLDGEARIRPSLKVIHRDASGGVNSARNAGTRIAESEWIFWLDDDDEMMPTFMERCKPLLENTPEDIGVVFFNTLIKLAGGKEFVGGYQFPEGESLYFPTYADFLLKRNLRGDCKPVFRRSVLQSRDFSFREEINGFESYDQTNLRKMGVRFAYYKELSTIVHQEHLERLSNTAGAKNPEVFLRINKEMVSAHLEEYRRHPETLAKKYIGIAKLAVRVGKYVEAVRYAALCGLWRFRSIFSRIE